MQGNSNALDRSYTRETAKATSTGWLRLCLPWRRDEKGKGKRGKAKVRKGGPES
jgi:hypothetical protein